MKKVLIIASTLLLAGTAKAQNIDINVNKKTVGSQIKLFKKIYNKPIAIEKSVQDKKIMIAADNLSPEQAKNIIAKALSLEEVALIETPSELSIIEARAAVKAGIETYKNKIDNITPERFATLVIDLPKEVKADELRRSLRHLSSKDGEMSAFQEGNQLIISDWTSNLSKLHSVISKIK